VPVLLGSVPDTCTVPAETVAARGSGKFWKSFGPVSASCPPLPGSFGVTPSSPRSMPRPPSPSIEFCEIVFPTPPVTATPEPPLQEMTLPATVFPSAEPLSVPWICTPLEVFGRALVPPPSVPT
jgi:hypothetical protein